MNLPDFSDRTKRRMGKKYINDAHRKYSEACQLEVREMMRNPLTREEIEEQIRRNRNISRPFSPSPGTEI